MSEEADAEAPKAAEATGNDDVEGEKVTECDEKDDSSTDNKLEHEEKTEIVPDENKTEDVSQATNSVADEIKTVKTDGDENVKDRQFSVEEKSKNSKWSYSQWSGNYESIDDDKDDKPIEEFNEDPHKLILWAAEKNELETLRKLLEENPDLVNTKDNDLYTPLHRASYSNNVEVIRILLSYDADVSAKTIDGWEPLHCACKWDSVEAVSLLLQNGADVNAQTKGHITPLHLAASNVSGRRTLELLLWQPYIDPNVKNDAGDTAYDIACRNGPLGALFEILEESVNVY